MRRRPPAQHPPAPAEPARPDLSFRSPAPARSRSDRRAQPTPTNLSPEPADRANPASGRRAPSAHLSLATCLSRHLLPHSLSRTATALSAALALLPAPTAAASDLGAPAHALDARRDACLARNDHAPERYRGLVRAFCAEHARLAGTGASLAVGEGGELRFVATAGTGCRDGAAVDRDTGFRIGSITKLLTAALALTLVDDGRLELDAPIAALVPELVGADPRAAAISIRQLLAHTAGLPDPAPDELGADDDWPLRLGARPLWSEPGALWSYSSAGYAIVGLALERLTGAAFPALLADRLLASLTPRATADIDMALRTGPACGHLGRGDQARELDIAEDLALGAGGARWTIPAGGVIASAADLVHLVLALVDPVRSPLSADAITALLTPEVATDERPGERYGLGVRLQPRAGDLTVFAHSGDTGDFAADLYFAPDRGFALALLVNGGDHLRATAAAGLRDLLGVSPAPPPPAASPAHYLGAYAVPGWSSPARVESSHRGLTLTAPDLGLAAAPLVHAGDHRFRAGALALTFVFADGSARATHLRARTFVGARLP